MLQFTSVPHGQGVALHWLPLAVPSATMARWCQRLGLDPTVDARAESRRQEVLGERLLLRHIVGRPVQLLHDADRRAFVDIAGMELSVAHTRGMLCIATSRNRHLGIDLELTTRAPRAMGVRTGFLNEGEQAWIAEPDAMAHLVAWTAKEAVFKAIGERARVADYREQIVLDPFAVSPIMRHTARFLAERYAVTTTLAGGYVTTLAVKM